MNINKQVTSKECFTTIFRARRSLVYCQYIVWFTLLRARASPCVLTRPSSCALLRLQGHTRGQWGQESLNALGGENRGRVSSSQGIYPMRATRILAARFRGGGGGIEVFKPYMIIHVLLCIHAFQELTGRTFLKSSVFHGSESCFSKEPCSLPRPPRHT